MKVPMQAEFEVSGPGRGRVRFRDLVRGFVLFLFPSGPIPGIAASVRLPKDDHLLTPPGPDPLIDGLRFTA
ncbi:MAG: hypothetical protein M3O62_06700 [Pseudomonadota bacterium]|nr:hypothetical protein [Pseudomonadota bacterium]